MKQRRITVAYKALLRLYKIEGIPFPVSCKLFLMKKQLQPFLDLEAEREDAILKRENAVDAEGRINMTDKIRAEFAQILDAEVDYDAKPVEISLNDELAAKLGITGEVIDQLDGFIEFNYEG
jgi:hypothetical protein